jgi:glycosyltransferase involved in cell wall biosynthesis
MTTPLRISVIVASHRPGMVSDLIDSLQVQTFDRDQFEMIVVTDYENGSFQASHPSVIWLYIPDPGIGAKRNAGARLARGAILAFTDDDCIAASDWIETGAAFLDRHPDSSAVEGRTTIERDASIPASATREYRRLETPGFRTNNLFFRTSCFWQLGGFDERFTVQREDMDLAFTAQKNHRSYGYSPDIRVMHRFRRGERWDLLKNCWNRRFDPLLFTKHPKRYCASVRSPFPPSLVAVLLTCMAPFFAKSRLARNMLTATAGATVSLLGLRRSGVRPFSVTGWARETVQVLAGPFVILAAIIYGMFVIGRTRRE